MFSLINPQGGKLLDQYSAFLAISSSRRFSCIWRWSCWYFRKRRLEASRNCSSLTFNSLLAAANLQSQDKQKEGDLYIQEIDTKEHKLALQLSINYYDLISNLKTLGQLLSFLYGLHYIQTHKHPLMATNPRNLWSPVLCFCSTLIVYYFNLLVYYFNHSELETVP